MLPLIIPSDEVDSPMPPHCVQEAPHPSKDVDLSPAKEENKSGWKSTVPPMVELLHGVRDSANGFGPLKSVAKDLCLILESCSVWLPSHIFNLQYLLVLENRGG